MNIDAGIKFINKRLFAGFYSFYYEIDGLIERYILSDKIYTYGNIDRGGISGFEVELEFYPISGWKIFGNFFSFKGKSIKTQNPLNDIPASRLFLGTRLWLGRFSAEIASTLQEEKNAPGPAEINLGQIHEGPCRAASGAAPGGDHPAGASGRASENQPFVT